MGNYILKRFLQLIIVLLIVSGLIFFMVRITPTDPIASIARGKQISQETMEALRAEYNLDKSLPEQYITWIKDIIKGDFGKSYTYRENVVYLLQGRLGTTIQLVIMSSIIIVLLGIPLGILGASRMNSFLDQTLNVISVLLVSSPPFFTGMILMILFTMIIPLFPTFGTGEGIIVETVFSLNGVGTLLVNAINKADYPLTQIIILFMVTVFLVTNFIVDILYVFIDPRIRLGKGA